MVYVASGRPLSPRNVGTVGLNTGFSGAQLRDIQRLTWDSVLSERLVPHAARGPTIPSQWTDRRTLMQT